MFVRNEGRVSSCGCGEEVGCKCRRSMRGIEKCIEEFAFAINGGFCVMRKCTAVESKGRR